MARKEEVGLKYFPLNSDIIHSPKIKLVIAEFGPKAWSVIIPLYCAIYRIKGYWLDWMNEDDKLLFAQDECRLDVPFVNEVVAGCIRRGLFDKTVFETFGVLTSDRIQENYLEGKSRSKSVVLISQFLVEKINVYINSVNVDIIDLDVNILTKNVDINSQKKRDKNKIKEEEKKTVVPPFDSVVFNESWQSWKDYKKTQHRFTYKSPESEQAALIDLAEISKGIENNAIKIIKQSIAKGWKGLFELKNEKNGNTVTATSLQQALNRRFEQQDGSGEQVVNDAYKRAG